MIVLIKAYCLKSFRQHVIITISYFNTGSPIRVVSLLKNRPNESITYPRLSRQRSRKTILL
ncbi:MAG: hypothetical protein C0491_13325 [Novosphingobium sp.]|nr:hypothetical protein [Novosphingobium sp.]